MKRLRWVALLAMLVISACTTPKVDVVVPSLEDGVDTDAWARVPAGPYLQGQHNHERTLGCDYDIMVTDVTNAQYADYLNRALPAGKVELDGDRVMGYYPGDPFHGGAHELKIPAGTWIYADLSDPAARLAWDGTEIVVKVGYETHPVTLVSWFGAWGYCRFQGWRLPTDAEWEKAARGTDDRPFPWGYEIDKDQANFLSSGDPFEAWFERAGGTTPVGFYNGSDYDEHATSDGASPYGLYDMVGNVWQWTGDLHEGAHYRSLRGGSHTSYGYNLRIWTPNNAEPEHVSPTVGFRCARDG